MKILFSDKIFEHNVLVCDILPEGILGQYFLLKYVLKIGHRKTLPLLRNNGNSLLDRG